MDTAAEDGSKKFENGSSKMYIGAVEMDELDEKAAEESRNGVERLSYDEALNKYGSGRYQTFIFSKSNLYNFY